MTAALGVNDGEIGDVVKIALDTPYVSGVSLQPQFGSGRSGVIDPMDRLTHTGVLKRLGPQTDGLVTLAGPDRPAVLAPALLFGRVHDPRRLDQWRSLTALMGHDRLKENLGLVSNRIADTEVPARCGWPSANRCSACCPSSRRCRIRRWARCGEASARTAIWACRRC